MDYFDVGTEIVKSLTTQGLIANHRVWDLLSDAAADCGTTGTVTVAAAAATIYGRDLRRRQGRPHDDEVVFQWLPCLRNVSPESVEEWVLDTGGLMEVYTLALQLTNAGLFGDLDRVHHLCHATVANIRDPQYLIDCTAQQVLVNLYHMHRHERRGDVGSVFITGA